MQTNKISLNQLESFLLKACDILRISMEGSEYKEFIFGMLFIKRMSDEFDKKREEIKKKYNHLDRKKIVTLLEDKNSYGGTFFVPIRSRWHEDYIDTNSIEQPAIKDSKENIGERLNKAIYGLEEENDILSGVLKSNINFNKTTGKDKRIKDSTWKDLIDHFNNPNFVLINENFEFPDLLGAAYEYLIKFFADSAGQKAGEFYTPNEVVRLMVQLVKPQKGMEVYDPTVGSGGMLIQSAQYVEESGDNLTDVALYGQDASGTVWAICKMNMILHNRPDAHIEHGDTISNPQILENSNIKKFDRVLANPPFSLNYSKSGIDFDSRFKYGYPPEKGKKADYMFIQHMIASLKPKGIMATVIPQGVLFRGGKEKIIREAIVNDNIIETIISLPPKLFYGTGIKPCILIINKNKPDNLKNKIFFINADAEYAEEKKQNKLRYEDIEKTCYVFTEKIELNKYSRLVDIEEIKNNKYNLNVNRYIDNYPDPEPQDITAHLFGGIPKIEINQKESLFKNFGFNLDILFDSKDDIYFKFKEEAKLRTYIRDILGRNQSIKDVIHKMQKTLATWWEKAKNDFGVIENRSINGIKIAETRLELLNSLKETLLPYKILDEFQIAGIFVNWWGRAKYDIKSISSSGWSSTLINDEFLTNKFFIDIFNELIEVQADLAEKDALLNQCIEDIDFESVNGKKKTSKMIKDYLSEQINGLIWVTTELGVNERLEFERKLKEIKSYEVTIRKKKKEIKEKKEDLKLKIELKKLGSKRFILKYNLLKEQIEVKLEKLNSEIQNSEKKKKKKINALLKDHEIIETKISQVAKTLTAIDGELKEEETKELILEKQFVTIRDELIRYLNLRIEELILFFEKIWDKYFLSAKQLIGKREQERTNLSTYLKELGFFD